MRFPLAILLILLLFESNAQNVLDDYFYLNAGLNYFWYNDPTVLPNEMPSSFEFNDRSLGVIKREDLKEGEGNAKPYRKNWTISLGYAEFLDSAKKWKLNSDIGFSKSYVSGTKHDTFGFYDQVDPVAFDYSTGSSYDIDPYYYQFYNLNLKLSIHRVFETSVIQTVGIGVHLSQLISSQYFLQVYENEKVYHVEHRDRTYIDGGITVCPMLRYEALIYAFDDLNFWVTSEFNYGPNFKQGIRYPSYFKGAQSFLFNIGFKVGYER
ncbi:hypothetical protein GYB22_03490 [bacterium]|nr:hypothetical protein [bacterium]